MAIQSDFMAAVNQICAERGIREEDVIEAIQDAILAGYRRDYGGGESLKVEINSAGGKISVFADKKIVEAVSDPGTQITLDKAKLIEPKLKVGDHIEVDVTPEGDFGRVAAQAAKQVILQKIREAEKEAIIEEFKDKMGTIETGIVQRMEGDTVLIDIRKATSHMPREEQIRGEFYKSGQRLKVLLKDIKKTMRGEILVVSRADPRFLEELFKLEVPELLSGSVEIKAIAREAGSRSKIAVWSTQEGVDPIGSCVGQRGVRIGAIQNELKHRMGEEKIDIVLWAESPQEFVRNALSPASVLSVKIDEKKKEAVVIVAEDQLSLAIGKEGQNVRLAAKLTGWKIDIEGEGKEEGGKSKSEKEDKGKEDKKGSVKGKEKEKKKTKKEVKKVAKEKVVTKKQGSKKKVVKKKGQENGGKKKKEKTTKRSKRGKK